MILPVLSGAIVQAMEYPMRHNEDIDNAPRGPQPLPLEGLGEWVSPMHVDQEDGTNQVVETTDKKWRIGLSIALVTGLVVFAATVLFR